MIKSPDPKRFSEILDDEVKALAKKTNVYIPIVEGDLGVEIGKRSGASIERWRTMQIIPAKYKDVEKLAEALRKRGGLQGDLYIEFLVTGGHPNANQAVNPARLGLLQPIEHFVGRENQVNELLTILHSDRKVVTVWGPAGVGKTALIAEVLKRLTPHQKIPVEFEDGIFYHNFYGQPSTDAALEQIARFLGEEIRPTPRDAAFRAMSTKQALLILDSAEEAETLKPIVEDRGKCRLLIVTRYEEVAHGKRIFLDPLSLEEAIQVLWLWSTDAQDQSFQIWREGTVADRSVAGEISEFFGRIPLALYLAGRYMSFSNVCAREFLNLLMQMPQLVFYDANFRLEQVLLQKNLDTISEQTRNLLDARKVLAVTGLLAYYPFRSEVIAHALGVSSAVVPFALGKLLEFGLLKRQNDGRYQVIHRLVHTYARDRLRVPDGALVQLAGYYTVWAEQQTKSGSVGRVTLAAEQKHLTVVLNHCVRHKEWSTAQNLISAIEEYLRLQGYWVELRHVCESGLEAAQAQHDKQNECKYENSLGQIHHEFGLMDQAIEHTQEVLRIAREIGDHSSEAFALSSLGTIAYQQGNEERAIQLHTQAVAIAHEYGDSYNEALSLYHLGTIYIHKGGEWQVYSVLGESELSKTSLADLRRALDYLAAAATLAFDIRNETIKGFCYGALAFASWLLGEVDIAFQWYEKAIVTARTLGERHSEVLWLFLQGMAYMKEGQVEQANASFETVLAIADDIDEYSYETVWPRLPKLTPLRLDSMVEWVRIFQPMLPTLATLLRLEKEAATKEAE